MTVDIAIYAATLFLWTISVAATAYSLGHRDADYEAIDTDDDGCRRFRKLDGNIVRLRPLSPDEGDGYTSQGCE